MELPRDDAGALAHLRSPPPPYRQGQVVARLIRARREDQFLRAFDKGLLDPHRLEGLDFGLLHIAAQHGALDLLRALIYDKGVSPNLRDENGITALLAAIDGHKDRAALFLAGVPGIELNAHADGGVTPLMLVAQKGMLEVVKQLVAKGAEVDLHDAQWVTTLGHAVRGDKEEIGLFLLETTRAGMQVRLTSTLLECAAARGLPRLLRVTVQRLRADGVGKQALRVQMRLAAIFAIQGHHLSSLKVLVEMGLDVHVTAPRSRNDDDLEDVVYRTLLGSACYANNQEAAAFLLQCGADLLASDGDGFMPHHVAAAHGDLSLLQCLFAHCPAIQVDSATPDGQTALFMAARDGHMNCVKWLVEEADADLAEGCDQSGQELSPAAVAMIKGHYAIVTYLLKASVANDRAKGAAMKQARNAERREKQKRARARQQQAAAEGDEDEDSDDAALAASMAGLAVAAAATAAEQHEQQQEEEGQQEEEEEEEEGEEEEALAAAIALSLGRRRVPPPAAGGVPAGGRA